MLEENYPQQMKRLLDELTTRIVFPIEWSGFLERTGKLPTHPNERRRFVRVYSRSRTIFEIRKSLPAIDRTHTFHSIFMRDLSRCGMSFIHSEQIYPGETCSVWLPMNKVEVQVDRCYRAGDCCYVIGAHFINADTARRSTA